jgi:glycosyltransferase involved in cell wall biosynthesis
MQNCSLPQVSVVIPAYNASKYIAETLETALNQRFRSFEIVVVDDGATDDAHGIVEKYSDQGVELMSPFGTECSSLNRSASASSKPASYYLASGSLDER